MSDTKSSKLTKQSWSSLAAELNYPGKNAYEALKKDCKAIEKELEKISGKKIANLRGLTPRMVKIIKDHLGFE